MRKKTLAGLISSLICISLIGVGFASWVIIGDDSDTETGTIHAEGISDGSVSIKSMTWGNDKNDANIKFDANSASVESPWLTSDTKGEDLTAVLTVTVENYEMLEGSTIGAELVVNDSASAYANAKKDNLIGADPKPEIVDKNNGVFEVTVTFTWGTHFERKNPYEFYNSKQASATLADSSTTYKQDALTQMDKVHKLEGVTFTLKITATAKTA